MFSVKIKKENDEKEYFVYNTGELIQRLVSSPNDFVAFDNSIYKKDGIVTLGNGLVVTEFINIVPVMISKKEIDNLDNSVQGLPFRAIEKCDYEMLEILYNYQIQNEKEEFEKDLETAWQYVKSEMKFTRD